MTTELDLANTSAVAPADVDGVRAAGLSAAARAAVAAGMPASTLRAYQESLKRFLEWAEGQGRRGLPCDSDTLTEYATYLAYTRHHSPTYIERSRWAIVKWHNVAEVPPPSTQGFLTCLKGYRAHLAKTKDPKARPRKATPASPDAYRAMFAKMDRSTPAGCRDAALLLLGFVTAARVNELAELDIGDVEFVDGKGMLVDLYRSKTRTTQTLAVKYAKDPGLCPVRAVRAWVTMLTARGLDQARPLFTRIDQHGHFGFEPHYAGPTGGDPSGRMTAQAIGQVTGRKALAAALGGRWTGHSGRRGFVTAAYGAGADPVDIADGGGWARGSKVMLGYIQEAGQWDKNPLDGVL